jgi:hypothetical protein
MKIENKPLIINGFCFIEKQKVIFVDLVTERTENYRIGSFEKFIKDNNIDEFCIFLSNKNDGIVTPLYKYSLQTVKSKTNVKANERSIDDLITLCYKVCIEMFPKKVIN